MKVILTKDVDNLGHMGAVANVKDGYARNFLIPRDIAVVASHGNVKELEFHKKRIERNKNKLINSLKDQVKNLEKLKLIVEKQVGEENKIFGAVTTAELSDIIAKQSEHSIPRKNMKILSEVKKLGVYDLEVSLHTEVSCILKFEVVKAAEK
jgi:large subunit ribosomal protein L9